MNKIVIGIAASLGGFLVIAASVLGTLYATGNFPGQKPGHAPEASDQGAATHSQPAAALIYVSMDPPFTMSFQDSSDTQYLQFTINVAVENKHTEEALKTNDPAIRNGLVMLMSSQKAEDLKTREGKERLRMQIRDEIRNTLKGLTGKSGVADVFFTSFVMQ
ncbi:MAG: flagellar basal body-associated FliL family protein [Azonexus sp.]